MTNYRPISCQKFLFGVKFGSRMIKWFVANNLVLNLD